jgi:hypothetical protein
MSIKDLHSIYPISWILKSPAFVNFMKTSLTKRNDEFLVADFASGEHDRVPSFFIKILPELLALKDTNRETYVYSIDLHSLRLDSLLGKLEEINILSKARVVQAKLESMDQEANMRPAMVDYIETHLDTAIWLDDFLIGENRFPPNCFDIGVLNNDIIGYMHEYYRSYSDVDAGIRKVSNLIRKDGLLIVTLPCSLYVVDNIGFLERIGFKFEEGVDIDLSTDEIVFLDKRTDPKSMSRLGHYTFILFTIT